MKIKINKSPNYIGWIVIILAFALLYFTYFFIYIPNQEAKLQQRSFRILKEYGNNIFGKNNYYKNHFKNYGLYYKIELYNSQNIIRHKDNLNENDSHQLEDVQEVITGLLPYVQIEKSNQTSDSIFAYSKNENRLFVDYSPQIPDTISQAAIDTIKNLYVINENYENSKNLDLLLQKPIKYKVPIENLMQGLKFDRLFENIILFDDTLVFYNSKFDLVADITNPKALCDSVENVQGGIWETINIRGEDKHVMILPIDYLGKRFCLAGLILDNDFRNKTRTINSQFLILIAAILLLIFMGMPILKIIYIDEKERLKAIDASSSVLSFIFGAGLIVLIITGVIKHTIVDRSILQNRIESASDSLYTYINSDIESVKELYISISDSTKKSSPLVQQVRDQFNKSKNKYAQLDGNILDKPIPINEIILIQSKGIVDKAVTRTRFSEVVPLDLKSRNYFTQVVTKSNSWSSNGINFYIESIRSYNTGQGETSFSFHNENNSANPVTAITSAVPSFYNQILPKDMQFVIINNDGNVLYHSIQSKNLHENFIYECGLDTRLLKAIDLRTIDIFHVNYNEKRWLARIIPIKNTPLFHITLIDLSQTDNKNARIFLFSFYFLLTSIFFVLLGMIVMRWFVPFEQRMQNKDWFLNWLQFQGKNYREYIYLSIIFTAFIIIQLVGGYFIKKPFSALLFQLIFIIYSSFVSLVFLNRERTNYTHSVFKKYYTESIILLFTLLTIIIFLIRFYPGFQVLIPIVLLIVFTITIPNIFKFITRQPVLHERFISRYNSRIKNSYVIFLFLWLTSISTVPVIQYYFSIKYQEEKFWNQSQLFSVAMQNIDLKKNYSYNENSPWFKHIQGNGIDNLKVNSVENSKIKNPGFSVKEKRFNKADEIYMRLPDPVSNEYGIKENIDHPLYKGEWVTNDTTLIYSKGGTEGTVQIISKAKSNLNFWAWLFSIIIAITVFTLIVWNLLKYIANVLLNLDVEKLKKLKVSWDSSVFNNNKINRILIHSFNGDFFLKNAKKYLQVENSKNLTVKTINALDITKPDFDCNDLLAEDTLIWINGFDQSIYEIDKHKILLIKVQEICRNAKGKVIVDLPFDLESIDEFYDDYMAENEIEQKDITDIYLLKKRWKTTFKNFHEFNGYLNQKTISNLKINTTDTHNIWSDELDVEPENDDAQFLNIWDNLTGYEKIVLYDLADDGLLNRKYKTMIQRLVDKKLIILSPYPKLFSEEFRNYVNLHMEPKDVKTIERKLGLKGKWRNIQYLILLILVPLAALILISQGMSIEKIFGIFAGIITVITGAMRVFDSNTFKSAN